MSDFFDLAKRITRAAYPTSQADPMDAPWDYLLDCERELRNESRPDRAKRVADQEVPRGCTCPNNGGGDCPWCVVYFDIMDGNVETD